MKISKTTTTIGLCILGCLSAHAQTVFNTPNGDLLDAADWDNGLPGTANPGTISADGFLDDQVNGDDFTNGGTVTVDSGVTLTTRRISGNTFSGDLGINGGTLIVNGTLDVFDDIFAETGTLILNSGSATTVGDDFVTNKGAGEITINGGTHTAFDFFGTDANTSILNILGGDITAGRIKFSGNSFVTLGGDATINSVVDPGSPNADQGTHFTSSGPGGFNILSNWTGSFTAVTLTGAGSGTWEDALIASYTLDGNPITATSFANDFVVSNGGQTLSLANPIPEPSTAFLVGLSGLVLLFRRRR